MGFISELDKASILNNGINFLNQRQYGLAKIQFDRYLNTYGYDKRVVKRKAFCHMQLQEYREAISCYDEILSHGPDQIALNNKGHAYNELKQPSNALNVFDKCTQFFPNYADGWSNKGRSLAALGRYSESIECYQRALQIDPFHIDAKIGFQIVNDKLIEMNAGINNEFGENIERTEKKSKNYGSRGGITIVKPISFPEYSKQDLEKNLDKYEKLIEDDPTNADYLFFIYFDLMKLERYEEALGYCDKLLEIDLYNKDYKNYKINCLKKLGKTEEEAEIIATRKIKEQNEINKKKIYEKWIKCPKCGTLIYKPDLEKNRRCKKCSHKIDLSTPHKEHIEEEIEKENKKEDENDFNGVSGDSRTLKTILGNKIKSIKNHKNN